MKHARRTGDHEKSKGNEKKDSAREIDAMLLVHASERGNVPSCRSRIDPAFHDRIQWPTATFVPRGIHSNHTHWFK